MKNDALEIGIVLMIVLFIFTTLVVFYEHKIDLLEEQINACKEVITTSE